MITQHNAINPLLNRQPHILHRLHTLQHNRYRALPPDPLQILPAQRLINMLAHQPTQTTALVVFATFGTAHLRLDLNRLRGPLVGFALAGDGGVDSYEDGFDAEGFRAAEEFGGFGAVGVNVELEEEGMVGERGGDDGWEGEGGVAGDLVQY